ncbi:MAG: DUF484 family protein [Alphaproteobacteria bacterium]
MTDKTKDETNIDDDKVLEYLKSNPNFWERKGAELIPDKGESVLDFQSVMFERLRENSKQDQLEKKALIDLGKANFATFSRIQDCILTALASENMGQLLDVVYRDWAMLLDIDVIVIAIETDLVDTIPLRGMVFLNDGDVDKYLGNDDVFVESNGSSKVFGMKEGLVNSYTLVRLPLGENKPDAMVAFGVSAEGLFDKSYGSDSIVFLCQALGYIVRRWLVLS